MLNLALNGFGRGIRRAARHGDDAGMYLVLGLGLVLAAICAAAVIRDLRRTREVRRAKAAGIPVPRYYV